MWEKHTLTIIALAALAFALFASVSGRSSRHWVLIS